MKDGVDDDNSYLDNMVRMQYIQK